MNRLLVLLVGVLFGALQSGVLAQDGGKFSYPRALERLESLVATLNESLHETKEDLQEVRLCLNQTKKILEEVQEESEVLKMNNSRLEMQLAETKSELAATKVLHQQAIDELKATQASNRLEMLEGEAEKARRNLGTLERGLRKVKKDISGLKEVQIPRQLDELEGAIKVNISELDSEVERVESELCEKVQNVSATLGNVVKSTEEDTTGIKQVLAKSSKLAAKQQESIDRLTAQVTEQGQSLNQLNDSVTDQEKRLDNLTITQPQSTYIVRPSKNDAQPITIASGRITDCYDAMLRGANENGVYTIHPNNSNSSFNVYCDMKTDGGGWTVLLKRQEGSVNFFLNWADYKNGFGDLEGEHWLGLENMYLLTHQSSDPPQLRVDLADWEGNTAFAKYNKFSVGDEASGYTLSVSLYQFASTAGNSLTYHSGQKFRTPDRDRRYPRCAVGNRASWWHKDYCYDSVLTGVYYTRNERRYSGPYGIVWYHWKGGKYSLRVADMKIKPRRRKKIIKLLC